MNTPKEIYDWMTRIEGSEEITNLEVWKDIKTYIGAFEQIEWERNVAISQLKDLGYDLGQKKKTGHLIKVNHPRPTANALEVGACKGSD